MGQTTSSLASKLARPVSWIFGRNQSIELEGKASYLGATPFVYTRQGSMYFDDDGDLAHEFYEEVVVDQQSVMKKCHHNLIPQNIAKVKCEVKSVVSSVDLMSSSNQWFRTGVTEAMGEVELTHPRLHVDFPVIMCEALTR